jgi:hypothetical protein
MDRYVPSFSKEYLRLFEPAFAPVMFKREPLTETKDLPRRLVSGVVETYVALLGHRFAHVYQDAYLLRRLAAEADGDLFLRARHYDLFFRSGLAHAAYERLLAEYPDSAHAEDARFLLGRLQLRLGQASASVDTFDVLLAQAGPRGKWAPVVRYFKGLALEQMGHRELAMDEYRMVASEPQVDASVRLVGMGATGY